MQGFQGTWILSPNPKRSKAVQRRLEARVIAGKCTWQHPDGRECDRPAKGGSCGMCKQCSNAWDYRKRRLGLKEAVEWMQRYLKLGLLCTPQEVRKIKSAARWNHVA
jgi:hypothetical protein